MINVRIEIEIETVDWDSGTFEREQIPLKTYSFDVVNFTTQNIDDIFITIMKIKGDGVNLSYNVTADEVYASYSLIFNSKNVSESDLSLVNGILKNIEEYFLHLPEYPAVNSNYAFDEEVPEEGILIMTPDDGVTIYDYREFSAILEEVKVRNHVISINGSHFECGAGNGAEAVMLFVWGAISSGVTWDVLKALLIAKMPDLDISNFKVIDNFKFKYLRTTVANRVCVNPKDLILVGFDKEPKDNDDIMAVVFKHKKKLINIECNKDYNIIRLEMR